MDEATQSINEGVSGEIRALMGRHRVSQKALAAHLGMTQGSVSNRLNGNVEWSVGDLDKVAAKFDVPIMNLFPDQGVPSPGWVSESPLMGSVITQLVGAE